MIISVQRSTCEMTQEQRVAIEFCKVLHQWLTADEMTEVVKRNKTYHEGICATHDSCDANMAMYEAFSNLGLKADIDCDGWEQYCNTEATIEQTAVIEHATTLW